MRPKDFKRWRKSLGLSQKDAAESLGLKRRVVQYYEKGERDGKDVEIPKSVRLACYALSEGVSDYHGPREAGERAVDTSLRLVSINHASGEADASDVRGPAKKTVKAASQAKPKRNTKKAPKPADHGDD